MATMSESQPQSNSGTEVSNDTSSHAVDMGSSGEPGSHAVNGVVSVALVQGANLPKAEIQTAEHVRLDDDGSGKCCTLQ